MVKHTFQREKFFDEDRNRWVLKSTRDDGASLQMAFTEEPNNIEQIMHYELIEFKLTGIGGTGAHQRPKGIGGQRIC